MDIEIICWLVLLVAPILSFFCGLIYWSVQRIESDKRAKEALDEIRWILGDERRAFHPNEHARAAEHREDTMEKGEVWSGIVLAVAYVAITLLFILAAIELARRDIGLMAATFMCFSYTTWQFAIDEWPDI